MSLESKNVTSNEVRIPRPSRGVATRVTRYREEYSVILHPDDYEQLEALDALVDEACRLEPLPITDTGRLAHLEEDRAGNSIEDPDALRRLLS